MPKVLGERLFTFMEHLFRLDINDLLTVPIIVSINRAVNTDELSILVAGLHSQICVNAKFLVAW